MLLEMFLFLFMVMHVAGPPLNPQFQVLIHDFSRFNSLRINVSNLQKSKLGKVILMRVTAVSLSSEFLVLLIDELTITQFIV
jgi:hypothetical protein